MGIENVVVVEEVLLQYIVVAVEKIINEEYHASMHATQHEVRLDSEYLPT